MASASDHPTPGHWTGRWCWSRKHLSRPWNSYVCFRRVVDLPARPRSAVIRISADARYTLFVNGRRIHHGPARSFPEHQSFDTLDLTDALTAGRNAICAIVHQFGVPTFQSVFRSAGGFLVDGSIGLGDRQVSLDTPHDWLCRQTRAWRQNVARLSVQMGFQEHYDADADPADWMSPGYLAVEEEGWRKPYDIGPVGVAPWLAMEGRGVPLLAGHLEEFKAIVGQFGGENARGYKVAEDVYHLAEQERRKKEKDLLEDGPAMLRDDSALTTVAPPPDGEFAMAVLDLGETRTGHIVLDIAKAAGDEIIDILYTEQIERGGEPMLIPAGTHCEESTADRYRCRPGAQRWESFFFKGFRYATLVFRNLDKPLRIRHVGVRQVHAAVEQVGRFECSDQRLNEIWQVGQRTLINCMFDAYVDCPWREQAMWWGDARVQFRANAYVYGDVSLLERGIRLLAQSQASDGTLHAHPPADVPKHRLPDFMLTWVGTLWDHYFHTGRTELLEECLPAMHRLFEFFSRHEVRDGLIGDFDAFWVFLDWQTLPKENFSGVLNLMYLQGLRWAAKICGLVGDETGAANYAARATTLQATVERYFWDDKVEAWRDGWNPGEGPGFRVQGSETFSLNPEPRTPNPSTTSQHMHALAILLGLKPETHADLAREMLLKPATSRRGKVLTASPFFYAFVLEAMAKAGLRAKVIEVIRDKWGEMIDQGATTFWELWPAEGTHSRCHAWSASPVYHLSQQVLGVMPVEAGWKRVHIAPVPAGLEFARGQVPSPLGVIKVEWEKVGDDQLAVRVDLPPGMEGEFVGPSGATHSLEAGGNEFSA